MLSTRAAISFLLYTGREADNMKAIVIREYGEPEVLKWEDYADPVAGAGEVLLQVAATSVNPFEFKVRSGAMRDVFPIQFPAILGTDVSGTVLKLGPGAEAFSVGDKVFAMASHTYAELCTVKSTNLAKIPAGLDILEAAALPVVTTTGHQLISLGVKPQRGQTVLVIGAAGSVGRSAVFAAKALGAVVIAGVRKKQFQEAVSLGADQVIATDDSDAIKQLTQVDAVADTVGGNTAETFIAKVKPRGVFASVLGAPGNAKDYPSVTVVPVYAQPDARALVYMAQAIKERKLVVPIRMKLPLKDAAKGHAAAEKGIGKVLLVN
jgi:NADPH:quinone reductase-like Zn-dependent oxidoreductase